MHYSGMWLMQNWALIVLGYRFDKFIHHMKWLSLAKLKKKKRKEKKKPVGGIICRLVKNF